MALNPSSKGHVPLVRPPTGGDTHRVSLERGMGDKLDAGGIAIEGGQGAANGR